MPESTASAVFAISDWSLKLPRLSSDAKKICQGGWGNSGKVNDSVINQFLILIQHFTQYCPHLSALRFHVSFDFQEEILQFLVTTRSWLSYHWMGSGFRDSPTDFWEGSKKKKKQSKGLHVSGNTHSWLRHSMVWAKVVSTLPSVYLD